MQGGRAATGWAVHLGEVEAAALHALLAAGAGGGDQGVGLQQADGLLGDAGGHVEDLGGHLHHAVPGGLGAGVGVAEVGQEGGGLAVVVVREVQHACRGTPGTTQPQTLGTSNRR